MTESIEQRVFALAMRHNGFYLFNNEKKQRLLTSDTDLDTDMKLDVSEAEGLMDEFFKEFQVCRGNFRIETYYPDQPFSLTPFRKLEPVPVPDFNIGMLIESAMAGKWLYD